MKISTEKGVLDLNSDFSIQIDNKSPIINDEASQSVPVTVPATHNNARITGFPFRPDLAGVPMGGDAACIVQDGFYKRTGQMHVVSASAKDGITINIGFDNAEAYAKWKNSYMQELPGLPVTEFESVDSAISFIESLIANPGSSQDLAVFQVLVTSKVKDGTDYSEYLNKMESDENGYFLVKDARTVDILIDDNPVSTSLPKGYGCTPFLYVGKVLEMLFGQLGYTITSNPFRENPELARLVVLNNTADAIVTGTLYYKDLLPTISVEEFLDSLFVRFGMVYQLFNDNRTVRIELLRDIVNADPQIDLTEFKTQYPMMTFTDKKQVKITVGHSFFSDATERFEDYRKGQGQLSSCKKNDGNFVPTSMFIELRTGNIYKWDSLNSRYTGQPAGFFNWDRQTVEVEPQDLNSVDEAVPMSMYDNVPTPNYLAGYAHRHTYLRSSGETVNESADSSTPLAFLLALPMVTRHLTSTDTDVKILGGTVMPYDADGEKVQIDGTDFSFSLLLVFSDGIFGSFWQKYDAILRHAANELETEVRLPAKDLMDINMLFPFLFEGQKLLPDTLTFSLPGRGAVSASVKMRTTKLVGNFNLVEEQGLISAVDGGGGEINPETSLAWQEDENMRGEAAQALIDAKLEDYPDWQNAVKGTDSNGNECWVYYQVYGQVSYIDWESYTNPQNDTYLKDNPPSEAGDTTSRMYYAKVYYIISGRKMTCGFDIEGYYDQITPDSRYFHEDSQVYDQYEEETSYWVTFKAAEV